MTVARPGWPSVIALFSTYFFMSLMSPIFFALGIRGRGIFTKKLPPIAGCRLRSLLATPHGRRCRLPGYDHCLPYPHILFRLRRLVCRDRQPQARQETLLSGGFVKQRLTTVTNKYKEIRMFEQGPILWQVETQDDITGKLVHCSVRVSIQPAAVRARDFAINASFEFGDTLRWL